jgi:hypothetical protein
VVIEQTRHCSTPIEAIAKIGGLLFVLRISFFIRFLHELLFEWKMRQKYPRKSPSPRDNNPSPGNINDTILDQSGDRNASVHFENSNNRHEEQEDLQRNNNYFKELFSFENIKLLMERVAALEQEKSAKYEEFSHVRSTLNEQLMLQRQQSES